MSLLIFFVCLGAVQLASSSTPNGPSTSNVAPIISTVTNAKTVYEALDNCDDSSTSTDTATTIPRAKVLTTYRAAGSGEFNMSLYFSTYATGLPVNCSIEYISGNQTWWNYRTKNNDCPCKTWSDHPYDGLWNCTATWVQNNVRHTIFQTIILNIKDEIQEIPIMPNDNIRVSNGDFVKVYIPGENENFTSCTLIDPSGQEHILTSEKTPDFELHKECGVRMRVNSTHRGHWKLYAHSEGKKSRLATFKVTVMREYEKQQAPDVFVNVERGQAYKIVFNQSTDSHCYVNDPSGQEVVESRGQCVYDISNVTYNHGGWWVAHHYDPREKKTSRSYVFLQTHDRETVEATVEYIGNSSINLLCKFHHTIDYCLFEHPNGRVVRFDENHITDRYEYYGQGFGRNHDENNQDCGVTIKNPKACDYGQWTCISNTSAEGPSSSILYVHKKTSDPIEPATIATYGTTYVIRGNPFKIKSTTNTALEHCSIQSPNGTRYQVSSAKVIPNDSLPYHGAGFSSGECGAEIRVSTYSDVGEWKTYMRLLNGREVEERAVVKIIETRLMSKEYKLDLPTGHKTLSCIPVPGSDLDIDYCRWLKPDGSEIKLDARYSLETNSKYCKLSIADDGQGNTGRWTCLAVFTDLSCIEHRAFIDI